MTKQDSLVMKGMAVLMMLFLHLFNQADIVDYCQPQLFVGGLPLVNILTRACCPVPFFMIISGYGMSFLYHSGNITIKNQGKRLLKLYIHYWIILLIFVLTGCFVRPDVYPGNAGEIVGNITSYSSTYNTETWFLFPYAVICLSAFWLFRFIDRIGNRWAFVLFCIISFVCFYLRREHVEPDKSYETVLAHAVNIFSLAFDFVVGAIMHRISMKRDIRNRFLLSNRWIALLLLMILIFCKCLHPTVAFNTFYAILFIYLFLHFGISKPANAVLAEFGKVSMPMWLIHSFFCYHLFHDFIYGFRYPIVIYLVLIAISYLAAKLILTITRPIVRRI